MKRIIIGTAVVLIVGGIFSYRYFYIPKKINENFTAKLALKNNSEEIAVESEEKKNVVKSAADKKEIKNVPIVANKKIPVPKKKTNLLKNGKFDDGIKKWHLWQNAKNTPENIKAVEVENNNNFSSALRIENPNKKLLGISQVATLTSGTVYRLSCAARSLGNDKSKIFGGRVAIYLPPQKEKQIVWMSEYDKFWKKELVFTNRVTGPATVYIHLGYGGVATTGEFSGVVLEELSGKEQGTRNKEQGTRNKEQGTRNYKVRSGESIWKTLSNIENNSKIIIETGKYYEKQCDMMIPLASGLTNIQIVGYGNPEIFVEMTNVSWCNECALNIPDNVNIYLSNITLFTTLRDYNTHRSYSVNLNGCNNAQVVNCIFESEIYGTNNNFKNFIATSGAKSILVKGTDIVTSDMTNSNLVWHVATHDAQPTKFVDCTFFGTNLQGICIGKAEFVNCKKK